MAEQRLGYSAAEKANGPYARFFNPDMDPLQNQVASAILTGSQAHELFPTVDDAQSMAAPGYWPVETGYTSAPDSSIRVFCLTKMPGVEAHMWDWWFGWHGCEARRYKIWHPKAHINAKWADGRDDEKYIGRTSLVTEYIGGDRKKAAISFVRPSAIGFDEDRLAANNETAICARIGMPGSPLKAGWLLHHVRPVEGGAEMRSRMWLGGENIGFGDKAGVFSRVARPIAGSLLPNPAELLVHNAQEMAHLAGFLPALYAAFGPDAEQDTP